MTQKDRVVGATLFQAAAHTLYLDGEPAMAQALLEFPIFSGRPDSQHPVLPECIESGSYSLVVVKPCIV